MPIISRKSQYFGVCNDVMVLFDMAFEEKLKATLPSLCQYKPYARKEIFELDLSGCDLKELSDTQWAYFCTLLRNELPDIHILRLDSSDFDKISLDRTKSLFDALASRNTLTLLSMNDVNLSTWSDAHWLCLQRLVETLCFSKEDASPRSARKLELGLERTSIEKLNKNTLQILINICKSCTGTVHSANNRWSVAKFSFVVYQAGQTEHYTAEEGFSPR